MTTPKRPRYSNPSRVSTSNPNYSTMDTLLDSLITVVTDHASIDDSIDRIFDSKSTDSEQNDFIQRATHVGSVLLEAGNRLRRKRASAHNAVVWPLPVDVTIKVFSMINTGSVCNAAAACSFFNKCAMDPLCYADIDLVTLVPKVNDAVVSKMIQRAGNALQSIKLGVLPYDKRLTQRKGSSILTSSCLSYLNGSRGTLGLRRLHLYNTGWRDNNALLSSLSICPSLIDLEIVCLDRNVMWTLTLESVSKHIPLIERLIFESVGPSEYVYDGLESSTCSEFVLNCPNITTLTLKGFRVPDSMACKLVKGLHKLKYLDFSTSYSFTGSFLENLGTNGGGNSLEVMILRNTRNLKKVKVKHFMAALLAGDWRSLSHLDISHTNGLASTFGRRIGTRFGSTSLLINSSFPIKQLFEQRPNFHLVADYGKRRSKSEELNSDSISFKLFSSDSSSDTDSLSTSTSDDSSDESLDEDDHQIPMSTSDDSSDESLDEVSTSDDSSDESLDEVDHHPV